MTASDVRLHSMNTENHIRHFIRRHGAPKSVAVSTVILVALVGLTAIIVDLIIHQTVHADPIVFSVVIAVLVGPVLLYYFVSLISQLDGSEAKLRALSIMDDLTDVYNRRFFLEQADKELAKARRYGTSFSLVAVDIDHLTSVNDTYGQLAGDAVLQAVANTCMNNLRTMDLFARLGGGEFMFLIPESDKTDVEAFSQKVLDALEGTVVMYGKQEIRFTASIGVKTFDSQTGRLDAMLTQVNEALFEAKRGGRNCIVVYDHEQLPETS